MGHDAQGSISDWHTLWSPVNLLTVYLSKWLNFAVIQHPHLQNYLICWVLEKIKWYPTCKGFSPMGPIGYTVRTQKMTGVEVKLSKQRHRLCGWLRWCKYDTDGWTILTRASQPAHHSTGRSTGHSTGRAQAQHKMADLNTPSLHWSQILSLHLARLTPFEYMQVPI